MNPREGARNSVIRSAAIWTPIFIASTALGVAFALIALDSPGAWVSFAIAALIALLSGISALGALRDIYAEPIQTTGVIERKWRKSDALFFRGHYILCQKRVFRIPREVYDELPDVGAGVLLEHYPHTSALTAWTRAKVSAGTNETEPSGDGEEQDEIGRASETPTPRVAENQPSIVDGDSRGTTPAVEPPRIAPEPVAPREHVEPPTFGAPSDGDDISR
jgi:hypothetical protein